jgi:hypothetical protein
MADIIPPAHAPSPSPAPNPTPPTVTGPSMSVLGTPAPNPGPSLQPEQSPVVAQFGALPLQPKAPKRRLWIMVAALIVLLLLASTGYVFAFYLPNTPSHVYGASLVNSGKALDKLVDYSKQQAQANYQSSSVDGSLTIKSIAGSYDVSLNGAADKTGNGSFAATASLGTLKLSSDVRVVHVKAGQTPDVYVRLGGIKSLLDTYGLKQYDSLDGQWIVIDHTFTDKYANSTSLKADGSMMAPTAAQALDAETKIQAVNKQYLFTTDKAKSVLANEKYLGRTTQNGRTLDRYRVGYNKAHMAAYVSAVGVALDSSQLNNWFKASASGKSLNQAMNLTTLESTINKSRDDYTFEFWADTKTKLISKVAFVDPSDKSSVISIGQNYTGGSQYPFSIGFTDNDGKTPQTGNLDFTFDTTTNKVDFTLSGSDGSTSVSGNFTVTPSKQTITVTTPAGAKSITSVLNSLGLGSLANGDLPTSGKPVSGIPTYPAR